MIVRLGREFLVYFLSFCLFEEEEEKLFPGKVSVESSMILSIRLSLLSSLPSLWERLVPFWGLLAGSKRASSQFRMGASRTGGIPWARVRQYVQGVASGMRIDPAPQTEHAWMRQIPYWRHVTQNALVDSRLARDEIVRGSAMRAMWSGQRYGGFMAWTLMGLVSGEVAYRTLVLGEAPDDVAHSLWPSSRREPATDVP